MFKHLQSLRNARASPLAYHVAEKGSTAIGKDACHVMLAWGAMLGYDEYDDFRSPFSTEAAMKAAEIVSKRILPNAQAVADNVLATSAGQLTASWMVEGEGSIEDQMFALDHVLKMIKTVAWGATELTHCYRYLANQSRTNAAFTRLVTREELMESLHVTNDRYFDWNLPDQISYQKAEWIKMGGNAIPVDFLADDTARFMFTALSEPDGERVIIPNDIVLDIIGDVPRVATWDRLEDEQVLALLHVAGIRDRVTTDTNIVSCLMLSILHLTKSSNVTENFITRRVEQLLQIFSGLNLEGVLTREAVIKYGQRFPCRNINADKVYEILVAYNSYFKSKNINPIVWIIEQSAASNVSSALAVANMVVKNAQAPFNRISAYIGHDQIGTWASLVGELSYDRFCSIIDPPYTIAAYPDLAYLGIRVEFGANRPGVTGGGYQGRPDTRARLSKNNLDALAETIMNYGSVEMESALSLKNDLAARYQNHKVLEIQGYFYVIPQDNAEAPEDEVRAAEEANRVGWPRVMRNATRGTIRLSPGEAAAAVQALEGNMEWFDALQTVATTMIALSRQEVMPEIPEHQVNAVQRRTRLQQGLIASIRLLGGQIKPEWSQAPPQIASKVVDHGDHRFNRYVRTYWGAVRRGGAGANYGSPSNPRSRSPSPNTSPPRGGANKPYDPNTSGIITGAYQQVKQLIVGPASGSNIKPTSQVLEASTPKKGKGKKGIQGNTSGVATATSSSIPKGVSISSSPEVIPITDIRRIIDPEDSVNMSSGTPSSGDDTIHE